MDSALNPDFIAATVKDFFKDRTDYGFINHDLKLDLTAQQGCQLLDAIITKHLGRLSLFCEEEKSASYSEQSKKSYRFSLKSPTISGHRACLQAGAILDKIFNDRQIFLQLPLIRRWRLATDGVIDRYYEFYWFDLAYYAEHGEAAYRAREKESYEFMINFFKNPH